jgi:hypothetical protein
MSIKEDRGPIKRKLTITLSWGIVWKTLGVVLLFSLLASGAYTNYHLFWRATGVSTQDGTSLNRAQLIDFVIGEEIKKQSPTVPMEDGG